MRSFSPEDLSPKERYYHMVAGIAPRPIAFVSTVSKDGVPNLAPFAFFNAFSASPPVIGFSTAYKDRGDGVAIPKDTHQNILDTKECVVNIVTYEMAEAMVKTAEPVAAAVNEFELAGFETLASELVKAPRVKQSPYQMECKLREIIGFGDNVAAGNLILCDVVKFHFADEILDTKGRMKQFDQIGRLGANLYSTIRDSFELN